jgi:hypothetical protein
MFGKKINNLEIDLEKLTGTGIDSKELTEEKKPTKDDAIQKKPNNVNFEFTNYNTKKVAPPAEIKAAEGPKPIISAFETIKNMVKLPASVASLIDIFFADQTKLDVSVKDVKDNFTVSVDNLNIPKLGLFGKASLSIPTEAQKTVDEPVKLHPEIEDAINKLLANQLKPKSTEEAALFSNLIDLALTLPNQNMHIMWQGNLGIADLVLTLPGGMKLTLELEINKIESGKDLLRTKLSEILGNQFADIEPLLGQTFKFKWNGETKEFKIEFLEQQEISLKSIKLKKGGFFQNMLRKFVNWITKGSAIRLPKEIRGKVDFENASVSFEKGSTFTVRGPLGISKKIGMRRVSFGEKNMVGIGLRCFGTQSINIDTRTSNVDSARVGIHPVSSVKNHQ